MDMKFIVSDESIVNSHGSRIITGTSNKDGINIEGYEDNMPVYYNHDWLMGALPIGQTALLEKSNGQLIGTPLFDEEALDDTTKDVLHKIKTGMLKAASIGVDIVEWSEDPSVLLQGQSRPSITKSTMFEWSIVGLPANRNCVKLSKKSEGVLLSSIADEQYLNKLLPIIEKYPHKMKEVANKLGLALDADEKQIVAAIDALKNNSTNMLLSIGKQKGVITEKNEEEFKKLVSKDFEAAFGFVQSSEAPAPKAESETETETVVASITEAIKASTIDQGPVDNPNDKSKWTFAKWSKEDPKGLREMQLNDKERYKELAKSYGK